MTASVNRLWRTLESMPVPAAVEAEWREWLGGGFDLVASFMKPEQDLAAAYPCFGPGDAICLHDVVHHDGGTIVAVCREESSACGNRQLHRKDLIIHRFDIAALCRAIAALLGLAGHEVSADVDGVPGLHHVGRLRLTTETRISVLLLLPDPEVSPEAAIERVLGHYSLRPFTLLVPTTTGITADLELRVAAARCTLMACSDLVTWKDGEGFVLRQPVDQILARVRGAGLPSMAREPMPTYAVAPHCLIVDNAGERNLTANDYHALDPQDFDLFIDMTQP